MISAWLARPKELAAIAAGAPVLLSVYGEGHPPVMLSVGEAPALVIEGYVAPDTRRAKPSSSRSRRPATRSRRCSGAKWRAFTARAAYPAT